MSRRKRPKAAEVQHQEKMRLDKWLWAARFFRTRNKAKQAINAGKVKRPGNTGKPANEITTGSMLTIQQGIDKREIIIKALSSHRRGAPEAALLYEATAASLPANTQKQLRKDALLAGTKPTKKDRRARAKLKGDQGNFG